MMRNDKDNFTVEQCRKVDENYITNSTKDLYQAVKNIAKKFKSSSDTIKSADGSVLCDGKDDKNRWKEYFGKLYAKRHNIMNLTIVKQ